MPANTPDEWRLSELNQSIEHLQAETQQLELDRAKLNKSSARAARRLRWLQAARQLRSPASAFALWPVGVLAIGPLLAGILCLLIVDLIIGALPLAILAFFAAAMGSGICLALLLYRPADAALPAAIEEAWAAKSLGDSQLKEVVERLTVARARQRDLIEERRQLMASGKVQRAALLQRPWKTMPEAEWEDFIVEVCRTLGATVERLPRTADKGANLLANFGDRRVAIVTVGEGHVVNSSAVQNALAGQKRHGCERCAVIINRRFTGAAQDHARHNGCAAIGLEEFPDFVMGNLEL
jgi:Restriction endonuclease